MDVYRGTEKVATLDDFSQLRVGANKPAFIYEGNELVYPAPVKDGLVLWYDFKGMTNSNVSKGVAQDLSGNGNHGTLQNFNFSDQSGYHESKLLFDGVDDQLQIPELNLDETAMSIVADGKVYSYEDDKTLMIGDDGEIVEGRNILKNSARWAEVDPQKIIDGAPFRSIGGSWGFSFSNLGLVEGNQYTISIPVYNRTDKVNTARISMSRISETTNHYHRVQPSELALMRITFTHVQNPNTDDTFYFLSDGNGEVMYSYPKLEKGDTVTPWTPHPTDYKTQILSPSSMENLLIYDRALTESELIEMQNYASKRVDN